MTWGVQTWDATGKANNYGLVPVSLLGNIEVSAEQVSGSWSFSLPSGYRIDYIHVPKTIAYTTTRRLITVNGSTLSLSPAGGGAYGFGTEMAYAAFICVFIRND